MAWKVASVTAGRYVKYSRTGIITADRDSRIELDGRRGQPLMMTPTGPAYHPMSRDDEVGIYLLALQVVPGPVEVTGEPPRVPGGAGASRTPEEGVAD